MKIFIVGHILLDLGLLGYISENTVLAYAGLVLALPLFIWALADDYLAKVKQKEDTTITN